MSAQHACTLDPSHDRHDLLVPETLGIVDKSCRECVAPERFSPDAVHQVSFAWGNLASVVLLIFVLVTRGSFADLLGFEYVYHIG